MLSFSLKSFCAQLLESLLPVKKVVLQDRHPQSYNALPGLTSEHVQIDRDDQSLVKRLLDSYKRTASTQQHLGNSMWQLFFDMRHTSLHQLFLTGTTDEATAVLRNPSSSDLFYGFDSLATSTTHSITDLPGRKGLSIICFDTLLKLAEVIGAIPLYYPELYPTKPGAPWNADMVVDKICKTLGIELHFPNPYPVEHGLLTTRGIITYRAVQALYQATRIKELLKGKKNPKVLEIGAGLGRTAYYARLLGIKDYTIVDIPFTALSSGYFLGRVLGDECVLLSGEKAPDSEEQVKFLTPAEFLDSNDTYDLILNADGFTEMDPLIARTYWKHIEKSTSLFLSINHEANPFTVKMLIDESNVVADVTRYPCWIRIGYVEEAIRFQPL